MLGRLINMEVDHHAAIPRCLLVWEQCNTHLGRCSQRMAPRQLDFGLLDEQLEVAFGPVLVQSAKDALKGPLRELRAVPPLE
jgi:hypothetical protein